MASKKFALPLFQSTADSRDSRDSKDSSSLLHRQLSSPGTTTQKLSCSNIAYHNSPTYHPKFMKRRQTQDMLIRPSHSEISSPTQVRISSRHFAENKEEIPSVSSHHVTEHIIQSLETNLANLKTEANEKIASSVKNTCTDKNSSTVGQQNQVKEKPHAYMMRRSSVDVGILMATANLTTPLFGGTLSNDIRRSSSPTDGKKSKNSLENYLPTKSNVEKFFDSHLISKNFAKFIFSSSNPSPDQSIFSRRKESRQKGGGKKTSLANLIKEKRYHSKSSANLMTIPDVSISSSSDNNESSAIEQSPLLTNLEQTTLSLGRSDVDIRIQRDGFLLHPNKYDIRKLSEASAFNKMYSNDNNEQMAKFHNYTRRKSTISEIFAEGFKKLTAGSKEASSPPSSWKISKSLPFCLHCVYHEQMMEAKQKAECKLSEESDSDTSTTLSLESASDNELDDTLTNDDSTNIVKSGDIEKSSDRATNKNEFSIPVRDKHMTVVTTTLPSTKIRKNADTQISQVLKSRKTTVDKTQSSPSSVSIIIRPCSPPILTEDVRSRLNDNQFAVNSSHQKEGQKHRRSNIQNKDNGMMCRPKITEVIKLDDGHLKSNRKPSDHQIKQHPLFRLPIDSFGRSHRRRTRAKSLETISFSTYADNGCGAANFTFESSSSKSSTLTTATTQNNNLISMSLKNAKSRKFSAFGLLQASDRHSENLDDNRHAQSQHIFKKRSEGEVKTSAGTYFLHPNHSSNQNVHGNISPESSEVESVPDGGQSPFARKSAPTIVNSGSVATPSVTVPQKLLVDWSENASVGGHVWYHTNVAEDCYLSDPFCVKTGVRKSCAACKMVAHANCIDALERKNFLCKPSFREASVRNYREQSSIRHHWVHRRRQDGKCRSCMKSFPQKFTAFQNKADIVSISCSWCKLAYHNRTSCFHMDLLQESCTLGVHANVMIPPTWIIKVSRKHLFRASVKVHRSRTAPGSGQNRIQTARPMQRKRNPRKEGTTSHSTDSFDINTSSVADEKLLSSEVESKSRCETQNSTQVGSPSQISTKETEHEKLPPPVDFISVDDYGLQRRLHNSSSPQLSPTKTRAESPSAFASSRGDVLRRSVPASYRSISTSRVRQRRKHVESVDERVEREGMSDDEMEKIKEQLKESFHSEAEERVRPHSSLQYGSSSPGHARVSKAESDSLLKLRVSSSSSDSRLNPPSITANLTSGPSSFMVKPIPSPNSKPLLVFINPKSGGNQGMKLLRKFMWLLNPRQVFDLTDGGPNKGLEFFQKVTNLRILACGGDGTAGWVLSAIDKLNISPAPPVAILPLGTGNDLSRTLNWGSCYTDEPVSKILSSVEEGQITFLDRWRIEAVPNDNPAPRPSVKTRRKKQSSSSAGRDVSPEISSTGSDPETTDTLPLNVLNNYFSIGADAHVALDFHTSREAKPEKFNSRIGNKFFYGRKGGKDIFKRMWRDLSAYIKLECDGVNMTPKIRELKPHCLVFLNIPSYAGGTCPWKHTSNHPQVIDDGVLEVLSLTPATMATLFIGGHGDRVCQGSHFRLTTTKPIPMQVDGEPCKLSPSTIEITLNSKATMLKRIIKQTSSKSLTGGSSTNSSVTSLAYSVIGQDSSSVADQLNIQMRVISLPDYESIHYDKSKLSLISLPAGEFVIDCDSDLEQVRHHIDRLVVDKGLSIRYKGQPLALSNDWYFIDYATTDRFFRIDRSQESNHYVSDIGQEKIFVLDSRLPALFTDICDSPDNDNIDNDDGSKILDDINNNFGISAGGNFTSTTHHQSSSLPSFESSHKYVSSIETTNATSVITSASSIYAGTKMKNDGISVSSDENDHLNENHNISTTSSTTISTPRDSVVSSTSPYYYHGDRHSKATVLMNVASEPVMNSAMIAVSRMKDGFENIPDDGDGGKNIFFPNENEDEIEDEEFDQNATLCQRSSSANTLELERCDTLENEEDHSKIQEDPGDIAEEKDQLNTSLGGSSEDSGVTSQRSSFLSSSYEQTSNIYVTTAISTERTMATATTMSICHTGNDRGGDEEKNNDDKNDKNSQLLRVHMF